MRRACAGIALISTLWILVVVVLVAAAGAAGLRNETRLARNLLAAAEARSAAEAGLQLALYHLAARPAQGRWLADGSVQELRFGSATLRVAMADEAGRIDLNEAPESVLGNLLGATLARRVAARRRQARFTLVEELQDIPGVTPALYRQVRWALTVHSRQPGIIPEAAPRQVLLAIPGADAREVDRYVELRARHRAAGLEPPTPPPGERRYFTRNGNATVGIHVHARLAAGAAAQLAAIVDVRRPGGDRPFRILDWRRESEALF